MTSTRGIAMALLAACVLAGCAVPTTTIRVEDNTVALPTMRLIIPFPKSDESDVILHTGHAVEIAYTSGKGRDTQELQAGQDSVVLGSTTFVAPQSLTHDFDFRYLEGKYRWRLVHVSGVYGLELLAGYGFLRSRLTTASTTQRATDGRHAYGVDLGLGGLWQLRPGTLLQARLLQARFLSLGGTGDFDAMTRFDAFLVQSLGRHAAARIGYGNWQFRADPNFLLGSGLRFKASGPAFGLDVSF